MLGVGIGGHTKILLTLVYSNACLVAASTTATHSVLILSQARSDLGAASAGGAAVFGGGCSGGSSGGGKTGGSCVKPSAVIDIIRPSRTDTTAWEASAGGASLSQARGWPAVCSFGPEQDTVAFLGGGSPGGSRTLDVLSIASGAVRTNKNALRKGRWGTSCAAANDGGSLVFAGGKVWPRMIDEVLTLDKGSMALTVAPWRLSEGREDCGAVGWGKTGALFAGGWVSNTEPGRPSVVVDSFDPAVGQAGHYIWSSGLDKPSPTQEWIGAVAWNSSTVFLADATTLYEVSSQAEFTGQAPALRRPLPAALAASAGIPAARVRIPGLVC